MPDARTVSRTTAALLFILFVLVGVCSFFPELRVWGLNHLAFYPVPVRAAVILLLAVVWITPAGRMVYRSFRSGVFRLARMGMLLHLVLSLLSVVIFYSARSSTDLFGDGLLVSRSVTTMADRGDLKFTEGATRLIEHERIAPGAMILYLGAATAASEYLDMEPITGIRLLSCLLGGLWVLIVLRILHKFREMPNRSVWIALFLLFGACIEFFFGYIEYYPPLMVVLLLYGVTALRALHGERGIAMPVLWWTLATYIHIQAILFLPSLLFVLAWRFMDSRRSEVERRLPILLMFTTIIATGLAWSFTPLGHFFLAWSSTGDMYGILSAAHLVDMANELVLLMPLAPLLIYMAWLGRSFPGPSESDAATVAGTTNWLSTRRERKFAGLLLFPSMIYLLLFRPDLGIARDWDLFAMLGPGLVLWALLVLHRFERMVTSEFSNAPWKGPAIIVSLVLTFAWVGVHASTPRSIERFEAIMTYDPWHAAYEYGNLARVYHREGNLQHAIALMEKSVASDGRPWHHTRLSKYYREDGRVDRSIELLEEAVTRWPEDIGVRLQRITYLAQTDRLEEMFSVAQEGTIQVPDDHIFWYYLGEVAVLLQRNEDARRAYEIALELAPPPAVEKRILKQLIYLESESSVLQPK